MKKIIVRLLLSPFILVACCVEVIRQSMMRARPFIERLMR